MLLHPLDLLLGLHLFQLVFDHFSLLVAPNFDQVGEVLPPLEDVGGKLCFGGFLFLYFLDKLFHLLLLNFKQFLFIHLEFFDQRFDFDVPPALEVLDFFFPFLADLLDLDKS